MRWKVSLKFRVDSLELIVSWKVDSGKYEVFQGGVGILWVFVLAAMGEKRMKRSLNHIVPIATSHKAGMKRVLLAANESGCSITQIAITDLRAGEVAKAHTHEDMQEGFYVLSGELDIVLDGEINHCKAEDFVYVTRGTSHELRAVTDVRVMTIGCEIR